MKPGGMRGGPGSRGGTSKSTKWREAHKGGVLASFGGPPAPKTPPALRPLKAPKLSSPSAPTKTGPTTKPAEVERKTSSYNVAVQWAQDLAAAAGKPHYIVHHPGGPEEEGHYTIGTEHVAGAIHHVAPDGKITGLPARAHA